MLGSPAVQLGYAVLLFDGLGQGIVFKRDGIPMRPGFETVLSRVLDDLWMLASTHPEWDLDLTRVAVARVSLGGSFALRAAAADTHIVECVTADPVYSLWDVAATCMLKWYLGLMARRIPPLFSHTFTRSISWIAKWTQANNSFTTQRYMFGPRLLVSPVTTPNTAKWLVYLPQTGGNGTKPWTYW
ncbi:hypothetical protein BDV29DRAFT_157597 [Aspergillus leporis]|uniref:Glycosyl hydrolase family 31 C-terminal domain-containing protein n=1 Tax=Aspergillus leporis TaxID=41062 RepID=A0A5N5WYL1_9EURO|nr:hypothetical protein BDV29DRAFT_157597 [Aspergillus leporis]